MRYDGQRAQIHILPDSRASQSFQRGDQHLEKNPTHTGSVKIFSRKLDDMTYKRLDHEAMDQLFSCKNTRSLHGQRKKEKQANCRLMDLAF